MSGLVMPVLETERLRIRPYIIDDLENSHRLYTAIDWVDPAQTPAEQLETRRRYV